MPSRQLISTHEICILVHLIFVGNWKWTSNIHHKWLLCSEQTMSPNSAHMSEHFELWLTFVRLHYVCINMYDALSQRATFSARLDIEHQSSKHISSNWNLYTQPHPATHAVPSDNSCVRHVIKCLHSYVNIYQFTIFVLAPEYTRRTTSFLATILLYAMCVMIKMCWQRSFAHFVAINMAIAVCVKCILWTSFILFYVPPTISLPDDRNDKATRN